MNTCKSMVIIGGGFAGTRLARSLEKKLPGEWEIYLLNTSNSITYHPLLAEVVGASVLPSHVQTPIRQMLKRTRVRMVTVDHIDFQARTVFYHNDTPGQIHFDQIAIASGVDANTTLIDGLREHSLPLKTVGDALAIRNTIIERLEHATIHPDPKTRKSLTTFVVIGGGFSGVEAAGEMEDFLLSAQRYYKNVNKQDCKVIIIQAMDRLLPELSAELSAMTDKIFRQRGIHIHLNTVVKKVSAHEVVLDNGTMIPAALVVNTVGSQPNTKPFAPSLKRQKGKISVNSAMQAENLEGVWALGDCAQVPNAYNDQFCPPTAQCADKQAKCLAHNIAANIQGKPMQDFYYKPIGMLAAIGHNYAVADIYGFRLSGFIAFLLWRSVYLIKVPTLARKVRIFLEWNWSMIFPADVTHLGFEKSNNSNEKKMRPQHKHVLTKN